MRYVLLIGLSYFMVCLNTDDALGISSKLDLDGLESPAIIGRTNAHRTVLHRDALDEEVKEAANLPVICISGEGCNSTKSNQSTESVETDVVVHVKTSVNSNDSKKNVVVSDTPEVPVIIGTDHKGQDENIIINSGVFMPPSDLGSSVSTTHRPSYSPLNLQSGGLYAQKYDDLSPQSRIDLKIEQVPSVSARNPGGGATRVFESGVPLHVPRFEPSFHRHYFKESMSPQLLWYPKNDYKSILKPPSWSQGVLSSTTHTHYPSPGVVCSCKNEVSRGLQWHPKLPTYESGAGRQINDKLAPFV